MKETEILRGLGKARMKMSMSKYSMGMVPEYANGMVPGYANGMVPKYANDKRKDGTDKDVGFLGEIRMPDGRDVMTEVSVGVPNTKDTFRPAITKGMHPADLNYIRETGKVPEDVYATSLRSAQNRITEGKSPFYSSEERNGYSDGTPFVKGPGTSTSDSVPAMLSKGEAVLPANTVQAVGPRNIARMIQQTNGMPPKRGLRAGEGYVLGGVFDKPVKAIKSAYSGVKSMLTPKPKVPKTPKMFKVDTGPYTEGNTKWTPPVPPKPIAPTTMPGNYERKMQGPQLRTPPPPITPAPDLGGAAERGRAQSGTMNTKDYADMPSKTGNVGRALKRGAGVLATGLEAVDIGRDMQYLDTANKIARVGEGASRVASAGLGAAAGTAIPIPILGSLIGAGAGYFAPDAVNAAYNYFTDGDNKLPSDIAEANRAPAADKSTTEPVLATDFANIWDGDRSASAAASRKAAAILSPAQQRLKELYPEANVTPEERAQYNKSIADGTATGLAQSMEANKYATSEELGRLRGVRAAQLNYPSGTGGNVMQYKTAKGDTIFSDQGPVDAMNSFAGLSQKTYKGGYRPSEEMLALIAQNEAQGNTLDGDGNYRSAATQKFADDAAISLQRHRAYEEGGHEGLTKFDTEQLIRDATLQKDRQSLRTDATDRYVSDQTLKAEVAKAEAERIVANEKEKTRVAERKEDINTKAGETALTQQIAREAKSDTAINDAFKFTDKNGKVVEDPARAQRFRAFRENRNPMIEAPDGRKDENGEPLMIPIGKLNDADLKQVNRGIFLDFLIAENQDKLQNAQWFGAEGSINKPSNISDPKAVQRLRREVRPYGDMGEGGVGFSSLKQWVPFTNSQVIDTNQGPMMEEDLIGDGQYAGEIREYIENLEKQRTARRAEARAQKLRGK